MKLRLAAIATFPLLLSFGCIASAQTVEPPPIKMGLWQSEVVTTMEGGSNSPMGQAMAGGHTIVTQGCLTPDTWKKDIQGMQQHMRNTDCTMSNFQQDPHHIAFDEACATGQAGYSNHIHFEMLIDDPENGHGHADMKMTGPAFPQGMSMHMAMKTKYLAADCGDVKPGEGKVIH
ncbi:MAG TPA: DUF3617 domain-containing protein [Acidobacteriaceae bacterium]|jgi:hypothetical protein|nr:DUF3617 domain-containing protein [Acidobacteriaceae bacterium]